jgi:hypothetical protein
MLKLPGLNFKMKKIIAAAYHLGRTGSSAVMGLLHLSAINIGKEEHLIGPQAMNPKGFFELKPQQKFLEKVYQGIYPDVTDPPEMAVMEKIGETHFQEYHRLIRAEFENRFPIAVKSQRFLTLPFLYRLKKKYDVKVLVLERKLEDQVNSTLRVWRKSGNSLQKNASREFVLNYIKKWKSFARSVENHYDFPFFHVSFDDLMASPLSVSRAIFDFIQEKCPTKQQISDWLDPTLVNRSNSSK